MSMRSINPPILRLSRPRSINEPSLPLSEPVVYNVPARSVTAPLLGQAQLEADAAEQDDWLVSGKGTQSLGNFQGWRLGVALCAIASGLVLLVNLTLTV